MKKQLTTFIGKKKEIDPTEGKILLKFKVDEGRNLGAKYPYLIIKHNGVPIVQTKRMKNDATPRFSTQLRYKEYHKILHCDKDDRISVEVYSKRFLTTFVGKITIKVGEIPVNHYTGWVHLKKQGKEVDAEILLNIVVHKQKLFKKACQTGDVETVKELLADESIEPGYNSNEALKAAVVSSQQEVLKLLLQDSRVNPQDALLSAISMNCVQSARELMKHPKTEPTPNHIGLAEHKGYTEIVKVLKSRTEPETEFVPSTTRDNKPNVNWAKDVMDDALRLIDEEMSVPKN